MRATNSRIFVTFRKEGIHCYPDAPTSVDFLKHPHRHMFHFKVSLEVFHNDREVEFIIFKRWIESLYSDSILQLSYNSCEMISDDLAAQINTYYPGRDFSIEVSEDGENGSYKEYSKE